MEQTHFRLTLRDENGEKVPGPAFSMLGNWMDAEITNVERWYHVSTPSEPINLEGNAMGKPEIIGYQDDHNNWSAPPMPPITFDTGGAWVESPSGFRTLIEDVDAFYRYHGRKRIYKPREFRAVPLGYGSYGVYCSTCVCYFQTDLLPHDAANLHAEVNHRGASG